MTELFANVPAYRQLAHMWSQTFYVYRLNVIFNGLTILLQIFLLKTVWVAIYAGRGSVSDINLKLLVVYLTLSNLQSWLLSPFLASFLQQRIREGMVAIDLVRPIGFLSQMVAQQLGVTIGLLPFLALVFPLAILLGGIQPPTSALSGLMYLVTLALAYLVSVLLFLLLGLVAFWTLETRGVVVIYSFVNQFFSGAWVPLWFFPPVLRMVAGLLPFQTMAFIPVAVYLGKLTGADLARSLVIQIFWVVVLALFVRLVWGRAFRRVVIQGG